MELLLICCFSFNAIYWWSNPEIHIKEDILPKCPYLPCVSMAGRALLAGYHQIKWIASMSRELKIKVQQNKAKQSRVYLMG